MRIGIDARPLQTGHRTRGIGYYTYNLIKNIAKIDSENKYVLFTLKNANPIRIDVENDKFQKEEYQVYRPLKPNRLSSHLYWFWDWLFLSRAISRSKVDLFHATATDSIPISHTSKVVATVFDLIPSIFPDLCFSFKTWDMRYGYYRQLNAAKKADMIITISESSKKDIVEILNIPEEKIRITYLAVDERFRPIKDNNIIETVRAKYGISSKFILYVGSLEYRKNLGRLIKAFEQLCKNYKEKYTLAITGTSSMKFSSEIERLIGSLKLNNKVLLTGFVADQDLPALYNAAEIFVFPSLYEGFGLPPLEAMACGTPVITSNVSSLPEIVSNAAILIDPYNITELVEAMYKVITNRDLCQSMIEKGLKWAKLFSWEETARKTLKVYEEVYGKS